MRIIRTRKRGEFSTGPIADDHILAYRTRLVVPQFTSSVLCDGVRFEAVPNGRNSARGIAEAWRVIPEEGTPQHRVYLYDLNIAKLEPILLAWLVRSDTGTTGYLLYTTWSEYPIKVPNKNERALSVGPVKLENCGFGRFEKFTPVLNTLYRGVANA